MKNRLTTEEDYRRRVNLVIEYVREHLDSEIEINTLAELSAFSPFHLHRILRGYLGLYKAGIEHIGVYYNNPEITSGENLMSDVCLRICKPAQPHDDIAVKEIPRGRYAVFTYTGEYHKVGLAYDKIYGELLAKNGLEPRSNYCMEKYVSDPRKTAPEKAKTEIYIPVE